MRRVWSSHIDGIEYDPDRQALLVQYKNGKTSAYGDVPPDVAQTVMQSESIGKAIHAHVRGKFAHSYVGEDE